MGSLLLEALNTTLARTLVSTTTPWSPSELLVTAGDGAATGNGTGPSVVGAGRTPPYWGLVMTVLLSATMIAFMVCALCGNAMVVLVIARHRGMRTRTNMFLCSLAVADFLTAALLMPVALVTVLRGRWVFGDAFCQVNGFLMPFFFVASIHTLMYISLHKYVTITRPFTRCMTRRRILMLIGAAWTWALLTGYVTVHGLNTVLYKPATTQCGPRYPTDLRGYLHPLYIGLSCYLTPFVIMAFCYARIFREMRAHSSRMEANSNLEKDMLFRQQRRITGTLIVVLVVFVVSWTPYILYSFYVSALKDKESVPTNLNAISYWFGYMNSACNPIIYALRSKAFREGYKELWCRMSHATISEATEPVYQHSTLHRLQAFIQNSLGLRGTLSSTSYSGSQTAENYPAARKVSAGSIANFLVRPMNRKFSTSSLPETFQYSTSSLPRISRGHGTSAVLARHSIAQYSDTKQRNGAKPKNMGMSTTNGFVKVEEEGDNQSLLPKLNKNGERRVVISSTVPTEFGGDARAHYEEDDSVFVVVADVEPDLKQESLRAPLIHVSDSEDAGAGAGNHKQRFLTYKSVSVAGTNRTPLHVPKLNQASSEANIQNNASPGLFRSILRTFQSKSSGVGHSGSSSPGERSSSREDGLSNQTPKRKRTSLNIPSWRALLRSTSEDTHAQDGGELGQGIYKAASDSNVVDSHKKGKDSRRLWHKKQKRGGDCEASASSIIHTAEELAQLQRTWSEKPKMLRSLSVEKLDPQSPRRSMSFTPSRKKRKKNSSKILKENSKQKLVVSPDVPSPTDIEMGAASVMLKSGSKSMKDRSIQRDVMKSVTLKRSWSDPCMTLQSMEHKISMRRQLRKQRHRPGQNSLKYSHNQGMEPKDIN